MSGHDPRRVPLAFALECGRLSWAEVLWAHRKRLIDGEEVLRFADMQIEDAADPDQDLVDLCWLKPGRAFDIELLASRLAEKEPAETDEEIESKWLDLALLWLEQRWDDIDNPPGDLEDIVSRFRYPDHLEIINREVAGASGADRSNRERYKSSDAFFRELLRSHLKR